MPDEKDDPQFGYGFLNNIEKDTPDKTIRTGQSNPLADVPENVSKNLYESGVDLTGEFKGVAISDSREKEKAEHSTIGFAQDILRVASYGYSNWDIKSGDGLRLVHVRVPELHSYLPEPDISQDKNNSDTQNEKKVSTKVGLHDEFVYNENDIGEEINEGDLVTVTFYNSDGNFSPRVLDKTGKMQKTHDNNNTSAKEKANQPSKDTTPSNLGGPANLNQFTPPPPPQTQQGPVDDNDDGDIILDGDQKEVNFSKTDTDSYSFSGDNIRSENRTKEEVNKVIIHWDAALNVDDQHRTLQNKGLSTHFGIGNDGTIYQFLDPSRAVAYHASPHNSDSIGIDISNAVYKKYQQTYIDRGHGERPIITNSKVHGRKYQGGEHLGYYEEQIEALSALMSRLLQFYNIPTQAPSHYNLIKDVGELEGVFGHLHVDPEKFDPAGLNFSEILS